MELAAREFFQTFREDHELMHLRDLQKLEGILSPSHLEVTIFFPTLVSHIMIMYETKYSEENFFSTIPDFPLGNGTSSFPEAEQSPNKNMQGKFFYIRILSFGLVILYFMNRLP